MKVAVSINSLNLVAFADSEFHLRLIARIECLSLITLLSLE